MSTATARSSYSEKLRDPRWQRRRLEIMERDKFACRHCKSTEKTLNVHHCFYEKGKAPWDYGDMMLVTLCEDCHKYEETRKKSISISTANTYETSIAIINLLDILEGNGPCSHPVFRCLIEHALAVCRDYDTIEASRNEGLDYEEMSDQESVLAANALKAISCLMEIRCMSNATVEATLVAVGI